MFNDKQLNVIELVELLMDFQGKISWQRAWVRIILLMSEDGRMGCGEGVNNFAG